MPLKAQHPQSQCPQSCNGRKWATLKIPISTFIRLKKKQPAKFFRMANVNILLSLKHSDTKRHSAIYFESRACTAVCIRNHTTARLRRSAAYLTRWNLNVKCVSGILGLTSSTAVSHILSMQSACSVCWSSSDVVQSALAYIATSQGMSGPSLPGFKKLGTGPFGSPGCCVYERLLVFNI